MHDIVNSVSMLAALNPAVYVASATGTTIDRMSVNDGGDDLALFFVPGTYTDGTHAFQIQESPDGSTWSNVSTTAFDTEQNLGFTSVTNSGSNVAQKVGYIGAQRYVRVISTLSGATSGAAYAIVAVLGAPRNEPAV